MSGADDEAIHHGTLDGTPNNQGLSVAPDRPLHGTTGLAAKSRQLRVLHVEDNEVDAELVAQALRKGGFSASIVVVQAEAEFERQLLAHRPDIVIADYNLPQWKGMEALEVLQRAGLDLPLILVSGALGDITAVECIKRGATDYVLKDGLARLPEAIRRALQEKLLLRLRRQAEEDLARKVEELARSNAELEQFAYIASHDLQEPLRMVAAYTQLLGERYRGKLDENADKFIGYACEGAVRMQTLIQDLLAFSRVGRTGAHATRIECEDLIKDVLTVLGPAIQESGAVVTHANLPAVSADRSQLTQLFQNLIANAIKFRGKEPPAISVLAEESGDRWLFTVSDNGIGIAPEYAENIFVVFQRLHARSEYPGNGIGLAICKKIVEHYGGKIWVEAQPTHGSIFKFTLPGKSPDPNPKQDAQERTQEETIVRTQNTTKEKTDPV
jgi:two-component system, sensor histidine kinase and response regulator